MELPESQTRKGFRARAQQVLPGVSDPLPGDESYDARPLTSGLVLPPHGRNDLVHAEIRGVASWNHILHECTRDHASSWIKLFEKRIQMAPNQGLQGIQALCMWAALPGSRQKPAKARGAQPTRVTLRPSMTSPGGMFSYASLMVERSMNQLSRRMT